MLLGRFFILFLAYMLLFCIEDKFLEAYYAIFLSLLTSLLFVKVAFKSKNNLYSPVSLFINVYNLYVVFGVIMWLYREKFFFNWDGDFFTILQIYLFTSLFITTWGYLQIEKNGSIEEPEVAFSTLKIKPFVFFLLLTLEYVGIFLYTAGFKIIPLLQEDIDASRFELNDIERPGAGVSVIFIYCGIFCIIHSFFIIKSFTLKILCIIVSYIPFLLYGGRLMMIIPLIVCLILRTVRKRIILNKKILISILFFLVFFFFVLMFYGTFRQQGENTDVEFLLNYASSDLFPELRGSMASYLLNKKDLTFPYISYILSMMLPGSIATIIGIDKSEQISIGSYIADLLGFEGFGIRTSITGELILTNPLSYVLFWIGILYILRQINNLYINEKIWGSDKVIYLFVGVYFITLIPYGINSSPNIIVITIFMIFIKKFIYKRKKI